MTLKAVFYLRAVWAVWACVVTLVTPSWAQPVNHESRNRMVDQLSASSTLIIRGRVEGSESRAHDGAIYTYATVAVDEVLKGPAGIRQVVVKTLGGATASLVLHIAAAPHLMAGDEAVMFLAPRASDGSLYPVGQTAGIWPVRIDLTGRGLQVGRGDFAGALDDAFRARVAMSPATFAPYTLTPREWPPVSQPLYTLLPSTSGGPPRWHRADDGQAVVVNFQTGASTAAIDGALALWNTAGSTLTLTRGGDGPSPVDRRCAAFTGSGTIELTWDGPCDEISPTDTTTVGIGGGYFTPGRLKTVGTTTFEDFVQGVAILNPNRPFATSSACTITAVAHLLGHAVGLGDSEVPEAVMFPSLRQTCSSDIPSLAPDDVTGIRAIYAPIASGATPPDAPTAMTSSTLLNVVTLGWTPAATGGAAQYFKLEAASTPGGPSLLNPPITTTARSLVVPGVPENTYYVRVRASNPWGDSAVSPETEVVVGPCQIPSAPRDFTATVDGLSVGFTWSPPASGLVQSYRLSAGFAAGQSDAAVLDNLTTTSFRTDAPAGAYYVRVAAVNVCGVGPTAAETLVQLRSCTAAPGAPANVRSTSSGGAVTVSWDAPATGERPSRYRIIAGVSPADLTLLGPGIFTSDSRPMLGATADAATYYVQVFSTNACGESAPSAVTAVTVNP